MIEVRIRKENEPTTHAVRLCELPADDIQTLLNSILEWGVFFDGGDGSSLSIRCQFVYYNAEAYFEVIICEGPPGQEEPEDESEEEESEEESDDS